MTRSGSPEARGLPPPQSSPLRLLAAVPAMLCILIYERRSRFNPCIFKCFLQTDPDGFSLVKRLDLELAEQKAEYTIYTIQVI